jgi:mannose-6-phosphate isomerase-like protein (cupin superfamily)
VESKRLFGDPSGETHFEDVKIALEAVEFAPPAPQVDPSAFRPAARYAFCSFPAGWFGDWHPTPRRQVFFLLSGEMEVEVSEGEVRHLEPGCIVLVEDTGGKGHLSRVVGAEDVLSAVLQLPGQA